MHSPTTCRTRANWRSARTARCSSGSRSAGKVYALIDADRNGRAERVVVIASGLEQPSGVAFHDGDLYIGAMSRILRLRAIESHLDDPPKPEVVTDSLPTDSTHGWKFIAFGPDGRLYVPIGAPCNICDRGNGYAKIVSMKPDGSDRQDVAYGIRNTVGFDWHPRTQATLVHRQRPRHARRRCAVRRARPRVARRRAFRLSVLPPGRHARSRVRQGQIVQGLHAAGAQARRARRVDRHALLHRHDVSRRSIATR